MSYLNNIRELKLLARYCLTTSVNSLAPLIDIYLRVALPVLMLAIGVSGSGTVLSFSFLFFFLAVIRLCQEYFFQTLLVLARKYLSWQQGSHQATSLYTHLTNHRVPQTSSTYSFCIIFLLFLLLILFKNCDTRYHSSHTLFSFAWLRNPALKYIYGREVVRKCKPLKSYKLLRGEGEWAWPVNHSIS